MNKIFCIGLSRTGTTSLCQGLELMGIPTAHFSLPLFVKQHELNPGLQFTPQIRRTPYGAYRLRKELNVIKSKPLNVLWHKYRAFGDLPFPNFFEELDQKFPNSQFIYTFRDEHKWLASMKWMLSEGRVIWKWGRADDEILHFTYGTHRYEPTKLLKAYWDHHNRIQSYFTSRPNDLLMVNLDKGGLDLNQIGNFLGTAAPTQATPRANAARIAPMKQHLSYWLKQQVPFYETVTRKILKKPALVPTSASIL
ncbi:MAG: sulfotransferase [Bacteroidota bacterium]